MKTAIYPGTFDPITKGHLDIIKRASHLFDHIIVAVSNNRRKNPLFSLEERKDLIIGAVKDIENVSVETFSGLLVEYAGNKKAHAIIRGLRAVSDFEYEFQMALMNRKLKPSLETVYLMPNEEYIYINSSIAKEVAEMEGDVHLFLPPNVTHALKKKFQK
ncbi:MAG: pantetheine-phosphate adenylyltransferase [bacterium]